jgi:hypothetical protein
VNAKREPLRRGMKETKNIAMNSLRNGEKTTLIYGEKKQMNIPSDHLKESVILQEKPKDF